MSYRANNKPLSGNRYTYHLPAMNAEEMVNGGWADDYDGYTGDADSAVDEFFEWEQYARWLAEGQNREEGTSWNGPTESGFGSFF